MPQDKYKPLTEFKPVWRRIDPANPPKGWKALFKTHFGGATIGVWYEGCGFEWYCGLPTHSPEDKEYIRSLSAAPQQTETV